MSKFYYLRSGQAVGPVDENRLKELIVSRALSETDKLFKEGEAQWKSIVDFVGKEIFEELANSEEKTKEIVTLQPANASAPTVQASQAAAPVMTPPPLPQVEVKWVLLKRKSGAAGNPEFEQKPDLKTSTVELMIAERQIDAQDFLWKEGFSEWLPADKVPQFQKTFEALSVLRQPPAIPLPTVVQQPAATQDIQANIPKAAPITAAAPLAAVVPVASAPQTTPFADLEFKIEPAKPVVNSVQEPVRTLSAEPIKAPEVKNTFEPMDKLEKTQEVSRPSFSFQPQSAFNEAPAPEIKINNNTEQKMIEAVEAKPTDRNFILETPKATPEIAPAKIPQAIIEKAVAKEKKSAIEKKSVKEKAHAGATQIAKRPTARKTGPVVRFAFAAAMAGIAGFVVYDWKVNESRMVSEIVAKVSPETADQLFGKSLENALVSNDNSENTSSPSGSQAENKAPPALPPSHALQPPMPPKNGGPAFQKNAMKPPPVAKALPTSAPVPPAEVDTVPKKIEAVTAGDLVVLYPVPLTIADNIEFVSAKSEPLKVTLAADAGQVLGKIRFTETRTVDKPARGKWGFDLADWNLTEGNYVLSINGESTAWNRKIAIAQDPAKLKQALELHRKKISYQVQNEKKFLFQASQKLSTQVKVLGDLKPKSSVPSSWFRNMRAANAPQMVRAKSSSEDLAFPEQWRKLSELHSKLLEIGQEMKTAGGKRAPAQVQSIREIERALEALSKKIGTLTLRFD